MAFFNDIRLHIAYKYDQFINSSSHYPLYYGIQYNHSGRLHLRTNRKYEFTVEGPHVFVTHPGAFFEYGSIDNQPRSHNFICFSGSRVDSYIKSGLLPVKPEAPLIKIHHPEEFYKTIIHIIDEFHCRFVDHDRLVLKFEELLLQLHEQAGQPITTLRDDSFVLNTRWETPILKKLINNIETAPHENWNFNIKAKEMNISPTHFRRLFKQLSGTSPQKFLIDQRLKKAAELLRDSSLQISEVGRLSGIDDEFYFSKQFKRKYSISPFNYRKEICSVNLPSLKEKKD